MKPDTRITVGLALVYFLNGLFNLGGQGGSFAPMIIYDSFLLSALAIVFCVLPPVKWSNVVFLVFALVFLMQQFFMLGLIKNVQAEITLNVFFLGLCGGCYVYAAFENKVNRILFLIPFFAFIVSVVLGYAESNVYVKLAVSVFGALAQILILARPGIVENLSMVVKRFYLLMSIMVFFDLLATLFLRLNLS